MDTAFGLYRARVLDATDPESRLRLLVDVPDIAASGPVWALPCVPRGDVTLPAIGATVWVAYERGERDHPVWLGALP